MARLGDRKPCGVCGGESTLRMGEAEGAALGVVRATVPDGAIPSVPVWECEDCEDRQPLDGELEN